MTTAQRAQRAYDETYARTNNYVMAMLAYYFVSCTVNNITDSANKMTRIVNAKTNGTIRADVMNPPKE